MDSSPRFRSTDSSASRVSGASVSPIKLRLMCSNGGHIVPRPHDKSLCYIGGETRMVVIDRHTTLLDLTHRLSKTLFRSFSSSTSTSPLATSFTLKYQLPSEDLDSLISLTNDEDLENMIEEYERLNSSSRLRLFIFPTNRDSVSSIGSFLENPVKSEDWFLNALNGTNSAFSDTSSLKCLLDLDDGISLPEKKNVSQEIDLVVHQDVHSIPDSPLVDTTSSFGSASSTQKQQNQSKGFDHLASMDSILSDLVIPDQSSPVSQIQSSTCNNRAPDPNDTPDPNNRIQILQQKVHDYAYLPSLPTTQLDSPHHKLHQQPQYIPLTGPVTCYYQHPQHPRMDQQNFMYYRTTNSGDPQLVRVQSGYQNQHQPGPGQSIYYATQVMQPLWANQHQNQTLNSSVEANLQGQQMRTAQP